MARVLNRADVINQLKEGAEIIGQFLSGFSMRGGLYDGWTVRSDTLASLLQAGLIKEEHDKLSHYYHYRWVRQVI